MKKLFCILLCLALCAVGAATAEENDVVFTPAGDFEYTIENGECTIIGYEGEATEVSIPPEIDGFPVTAIGYQAFYCCGGLTAVTIPEGVTGIGIYAFFDCESLTTVTIPEGVTRIARAAFAYCSHLTDITFPSTMTSIEEYAFYFCETLAAVTIPEGVTSIGICAFAECGSLQTICCAPDSFAQTWAEANGFAFSRPDEED